MEILGYMAAVFMGLSLGLIGGGGSILTVPILVYLFAINPLIATSLSLFVVGSTALVGSLLAFWRKEVELKIGIIFAIPSFLGVFLTKTVLLPRIPDQIFSTHGFVLTKPLLVMGFFAILMLLASLAMIRTKKVKMTSPEQVAAQGAKEINFLAVSGQGFLVGGVTGFVGAGGGFLIVPALVNIVGLNMRKAIGTSLLIIAANSLFGFSVSLAEGLVVDWQLLLSILAVSLLGLFVGSFLSKKVSEGKLKSIFGYFVLIMGSFILLDQIKKL